VANAIHVIVPYRHASTWVFDDPRVGLSQEPFVSGIPEMIDTIGKEKGSGVFVDLSPASGAYHPHRSGAGSMLAPMIRLMAKRKQWCLCG
jgi:hypothetical protein